MSSLDTVLSEDYSRSSSSQGSAGSEADTDLPEAGEAIKGTQRKVIKGGWWSVGSEKHDEGLCKPCNWVHSKIGCKSGQNCAFCHLPHFPAKDQTKQNKPGKKARDRCKKWLDFIDEASEDP